MTMTSGSDSSKISQGQKLLLLFAGLLLGCLLFFLRGGLNSEAPLDQLARRSLDPESALTNGIPTVFEFYADWCEACREMAPAMLATEHQNDGNIDFVLLNIACVF